MPSSPPPSSDDDDNKNKTNAASSSSWIALIDNLLPLVSKKKTEKEKGRSACQGDEGGRSKTKKGLYSTKSIEKFLFLGKNRFSEETGRTAGSTNPLDSPHLYYNEDDDNINTGGGTISGGCAASETAAVAHDATALVVMSPSRQNVAGDGQRDAAEYDVEAATGGGFHKPQHYDSVEDEQGGTPPQPEAAAAAAYPANNPTDKNEETTAVGGGHPKRYHGTTDDHPDDEDEALQRKRDKRAVWRLRVTFVITLVSATAIVATLAYHFTRSFETDLFVQQYESASQTLLHSFQDGVSRKVFAAQTFSAMYTSRYGEGGDTDELSDQWPNATMPNFQEQAEGQLILSGGRALSFNPLVDNDTERTPWEVHAAENAYILGSDQLIDRDQSKTGRIVSDGIFRVVNKVRVDDPGIVNGDYPKTLVPVWQIAPIETNEAAVMFNLKSVGNRQRALDDMMKFDITALTDLLQLVQDTEVRPSSILFFPVFDTFNNLTASGTARRVVGSISIVFSWDDVFRGSLPSNVKGIICVLETNFNKTFTYKVSGGDAVLLGEGDRHESKYDHMERRVQASLNGTQKDLGIAEDLAVYSVRTYPSTELEMTYRTRMPAIYALIILLIFVVVSMIFMLYDYLAKRHTKKLERVVNSNERVVESMFPKFMKQRIIHHVNEEKEKQKRRLSNASSTGDHHPQDGERGGRGRGKRPDTATTTWTAESVMADTSGRTYPGGDGTRTDNVHEEMQDTFPSIPVNPSVGRSYKSRSSTSSLPGMKDKKTLLKSILRGAPSSPAKLARFPGLSEGKTFSSGGAENRRDEPPLQTGKPIADYFPHTTVLFADLAGFTSWSANRPPEDVFNLLERVFAEFDALATRFGVFKVETIGDCYTAVTGLPEPQDDHAMRMCEFALACQRRFRKLRRRMEPELGKGVRRLEIRMGCHSGGVTAGVLRGERARFQLFGKTVYIASEMEATGTKGRIQVSSSTAKHLARTPKENVVVTKRGTDEPVERSSQQTFWVDSAASRDSGARPPIQRRRSLQFGTPRRRSSILDGDQSAYSPRRSVVRWRTSIVSSARSSMTSKGSLLQFDSFVSFSKDTDDKRSTTNREPGQRVESHDHFDTALSLGSVGCPADSGDTEGKEASEPAKQSENGS